jgi:uncharacterized protein (TIGR03067 family)
MKRSLLALAVLAAGAAPAAAQPEAAKKDLDRMQGTWVLIGGRINGRDVTPNEAQIADIVVVIKGDEMRAIFKGKPSDSVSRMKLDPSKSPAQVDTEDIEGPGKGTKNYGIYAVDGEILKLCIRDKANGRPPAFDSKEEGNFDDCYLILKRVIPKDLLLRSTAAQILCNVVHPAVGAGVAARLKQ